MHFVKWITLVMLMVTNALSLKAVTPDKIIINQLQDELIAPEGENYQWFFNGQAIENARSINLVPKNSGSYSVTYVDANNNWVEKSIMVSVQEDGIIRIFIIGDSTVANYSESAYPFAGWGQVLNHFFDQNQVSIHNRARGGRSSRSYYEEGLWDNVVSELDSGNYVFIQFGHNDRDYSTASRYTTTDSMKYFLRVYINESREKGAIPVLVSPMNMNTGTRNVFTESGSDYRGAMLDVATELNVPFIDLNLKSYDFYQQVGTTYASYFIHMGLEPGEYTNYPDGYSDTWTHYQEMGALAMARMITEEIDEKQANTELAPLADLLMPLYPVSVALNNPDAGLVTLSGEYPEGATVTLKARLNETSDVLTYWVDSIENITLDGSLVTFTMEPRNYAFTGFVTDCYGTVNGTASIDECGVCTGGETGLDPCTSQIPFIEFCESNTNIQILLNEELYSMAVSTGNVKQAYIEQKLNVATSGSYLFAISYSNPTEAETFNIYVDDVLTLSGLTLEVGSAWNVIDFSLDLTEGEHVIDIQTTSESGGVLLDYLAIYSEAVTQGTCSHTSEGQEGVFVQSDSLIVIEAENYTSLKAGANADNWTKALFDDSSNGSVIIAPDGTSYGAASVAQSSAPAVRYKVNFPYTGNYSVWARVYAFSGSSDSYHLGLDGKVLIEKIDMYDSTDEHETFAWMHVSGKTLKVSNTGEQSLDVFCREPNLIIDKIILSLDAGYSPTGYGPDQTLDSTATALNYVSGNADQLQVMVYPNPARDQIQIAYNLKESNQVNIHLLNINGQTIANLSNAFQTSGKHELSWNIHRSSGSIPDGLYFIRIQAGNAINIKKINIQQ